MSENTLTTVYTCPETIRWVKDTNQVIIVDEQAGRIFTLRGVDAAIWSWLSLRYSYQMLIKLVAALLAVSGNEAEDTLRTTLQAWCSRSLLKAVERSAHG